MDTPSLKPSGSNPELLIGQKLALAGASLALGVCSFINLMGMEKAILAIVFGAMALSKGPGLLPVRRRAAKFGVALGISQIVAIVTLLIVCWDRVLRFFEFLERFQTQM